MRRFNFWLLLSFLILYGTSCKRTACFSIESENYLNPRYPIQFRNCSENATRFEWDFGDGSSSSEAEPRHTYASPGSYVVTLVVEDGIGEHVTQQTIDLDYAHIESIRILSMSATKPNGDPWDPDGSGPDLIVSAHEIDDPPGLGYFSTHRVRNVVPPQDLFGQVTIDMNGLTFMVLDVNEPLVTDNDTVGLAYRTFEQLADAPVERVEGSNVVYEIHMSH